MKRYTLLIILLAISITNFAKTEKEIVLVYGKSIGPARISFLRSNYMIRGIGSSYLRENNSIGLRFLTNINSNQKLKIETGINYLSGNLEHVPYLFDETSTIEKFNLVSTPIYLNHYFGKYFYFNEGIMFDYQKSESELYTGFGAGIGFGIGFKFDFKNFRFYINPKYERHLFLSKKYGLIEYGIMFGAGYKF
jgi:hypothetical protein